jgi:hypothetical protein
MPQEHAIDTNVFHFRKNSVEQAASWGAAEKLWSLQKPPVVKNRCSVMKIKAKNGPGKTFLTKGMTEDRDIAGKYYDY